MEKTWKRYGKTWKRRTRKNVSKLAKQTNRRTDQMTEQNGVNMNRRQIDRTLSHFASIWAGKKKLRRKEKEKKNDNGGRVFFYVISAVHIANCRF